MINSDLTWEESGVTLKRAGCLGPLALEVSTRATPYEWILVEEKDALRFILLLRDLSSSLPLLLLKD